MFLELFWNIRKIKNYQMQTGKEFIMRTFLKRLPFLGLQLISLWQMHRHRNQQHSRTEIPNCKEHPNRYLHFLHLLIVLNRNMLQILKLGANIEHEYDLFSSSIPYLTCKDFSSLYHRPDSQLQGRKRNSTIITEHTY